MITANLQYNTSVDSYFNVLETWTLELFNYVSFDFLKEFDLMTPSGRSSPRSCANTYFAFCLRRVVVITDYEQGDIPENTVITI